MVLASERYVVHRRRRRRPPGHQTAAVMAAGTEVRMPQRAPLPIVSRLLAGALVALMAACSPAAPITRTRTVTLAGSGTGAVTSDPTGTDTSVVGGQEASFTDGTVVTLSATARDGAATACVTRKQRGSYGEDAGQRPTRSVYQTRRRLSRAESARSAASIAAAIRVA